MSQAPTTIDGMPCSAADASVEERSEFLVKTYLHLFGAIIAFVVLLTVWMQMPGIDNLAQKMMSGWNWLIVLAAFMGVSYIAERMAHNAVSLPTQYVGLGLYVLAESVIFIPLIWYAIQLEKTLGPIITPAVLATAIIFTALTAIVLITRKNFSWLRSGLMIAGIAALVLIVASIAFGFSLGIIFSVAMVVFASLWILYTTSQVLHDYQTSQYVSASLALFAAVALLFWYILRIAMWVASMGRD